MKPQPDVAELASEVLRVMYEERIGVSPAVCLVVTKREFYALLKPVEEAVLKVIKEHEELRDMILGQLRTERRSSVKTFVGITADKMAEKEERALIIKQEPFAQKNGQFLLF